MSKKSLITIIVVLIIGFWLYLYIQQEDKVILEKEIQITKTKKDHEKTIREIRAERAVEEFKKKEANKIPKWIQVYATFKEWFKNSWYAKSDTFCFSLRVGSREKWKYYNVLRNSSEWVSNNISQWLTGCVAGSIIANTTEAIRTIPFWQVAVANKRSYWWSRDVLVNTWDKLEEIEMMTSGTKDGDPIDLSLSYWY